jgi:hypothetical protein
MPSGLHAFLMDLNQERLKQMKLELTRVILVSSFVEFSAQRLSPILLQIR